MKRICIAIIILVIFAACEGKRSTSITVTDPRTGAVNTLEHESDTRKCGEQRNCAKEDTQN